MAPVQISKEAFDVALMLGGRFVVCLFKLGVADEGLTVLTPVLGLSQGSAMTCQTEIVLYSP